MKKKVTVKESSGEKESYQISMKQVGPKKSPAKSSTKKK
jgi:hypothetical protein